MPFLSFIFKTAKSIPIAGKFEDKALLNKAFDDIDQALAEGNLVCIFPEGRITFTGKLITFRDGIETILERRQVPVYPLALQGLWGSVFSRQKSNVFQRLLKGFKSCVGLNVGEMVAAEDANAKMLQQKVQELYDSKV